MSYFIQEKIQQKASDFGFLLSKFLKELISTLLKSESIKESLSIKPDVRLKDLFSSFDSTSRGYITSHDFKETLQQKLDIFANIEDIKILFKTYDFDLDSKLNFPEFSEMLMPKKNEYAILHRERKIKSSKSISIESKLVLIKLISSLIEAESAIEDSRKLLTNNKKLSSYDLFDMVKGKYQNYIVKEDVSIFF